MVIMDMYLKAIEEETEKENALKVKKKKLADSNRSKKESNEYYSYREEQLVERIEDENQRKFYLENRQSCLKEYLKGSVRFGILTGIFFAAIVLGLSFFESIWNVDAITISIPALFGGTTAVGGILGLVEFQNLSRDFFRLLRKGDTDVDKTLESLQSELENVRSIQHQNQISMEENQILLGEIDIVLHEIHRKIETYQNERNTLISGIIQNLDNYIQPFDYQETDIHKVIEKKIH